MRPKGAGDDAHTRQGPRVGHGVLYGFLGDFVEHHAVHCLVLELLAALQQLVQVPGDGLTLAIGVGREIEGVGILELGGDRLDVLVIAVDHLVFHGEVIARVDRAFLGHQVAHVTIGGQDLEVLAQVFFDRLRLGRRLNDDQIHKCLLGNSGSPGTGPPGQFSFYIVAREGGAVSSR